MKARRIDFSTSLSIIFTHWYFLFYTNMVFCTSLIIFLPQINPVFSHLHPWVHVILASWHTIANDTSDSRQVFFPCRGLHGFFPAGSGTSSLWPYVHCAAFSQSSFPDAYVVFSMLFSNYRVSTLKTGNFSSLPTAWHRVSAQNIFNE